MIWFHLSIWSQLKKYFFTASGTSGGYRPFLGEVAKTTHPSLPFVLCDSTGSRPSSMYRLQSAIHLRWGSTANDYTESQCEWKWTYPETFVLLRQGARTSRVPKFTACFGHHCSALSKTGFFDRISVSPSTLYLSYIGHYSFAPASFPTEQTQLTRIFSFMLRLLTTSAAVMLTMLWRLCARPTSGQPSVMLLILNLMIVVWGHCSLQHRLHSHV